MVCMKWYNANKTKNVYKIEMHPILIVRQSYIDLNRQ